MSAHAQQLSGLALTVLPIIATAIAAVTDARTGRIPNWLTLPLGGVGLALHTAVGGLGGALLSLSGLALAGALPWLLYRSTSGKAIGGGDVKLFAGLGALMGPFLGLELELSAFIVLGIFLLVRLSFSGGLFRVLKNTVFVALGPVLPSRWRKAIEPTSLTEVRMGPAIAVAALSVALRGELSRLAPWLG
jgi:prepilin peptidase CpaA